MAASNSEAKIMKRDIYSEVSARIVAELEAGAAPWVKPWSATPGHNMPMNVISGKAYQGVNVILLWMAGAGYAKPHYLTYKQAESLGGHVKKGERGTTILFADRFVPEDERQRAAEVGEEARAIPFLKRFTVFNIDQCEGISDDIAASTVRLPPDQIAPQAEALIAATGANFRIGGAHAYYNTTSDFVQVPPPAAYCEPINWHRTAFHELSHYADLRIMPCRCAFPRTGAQSRRGMSA